MYYFASRIAFGAILLLVTQASSDELYDKVEAADTADCLKKARILVVPANIYISSFFSHHESLEAAIIRFIAAYADTFYGVSPTHCYCNLDLLLIYIASLVSSKSRNYTEPNRQRANHLFAANRR